MKEMVLAKDLKKKAKGKTVRLVQEWLSLHGIHLAADGDFGPATEYGIKQFQKKKKLKEDGIVDQGTFEQLILPMTTALKPIAPGRRTPGQLVIAYAKQHLKQHPVEIGGQNKGPWVRLYMKGNEGPEWPWCAGFVSFILTQAYGGLNVSLPIETSFSCDILAANAKEKERFLAESQIQEKAQIKAGSIFLNRRVTNDWVHTGIVLKAEEEFFHTIEGNTNDEGSREGYEVCQRIRGYKKKDFIMI